MRVVCCIYWKGNFKRRETMYNVTWVYKLRSMVARNLTGDYRFVCLTNVPEEFDDDIETINLKHNWKGWWSKIELFRPDLFDDGDRILFMDLDTFIVGDLAPLFEFDAEFTTCSALTQRKRGVYKDNNELRIIKYSSTVIVWTPPAGKVIYEKFDFNKVVKRDKYVGDQDWMATCLPDIKTLPIEYVRRLRDLDGGMPEKDTIIVLPIPRFGGKNIQALLEYRYLKKIWRE